MSKQDEEHSVADEEQTQQPLEETAPKGGASETAEAGRPEGAPPSPARRRGGPRTAAGKERSKYNAVKYSFFSRSETIQTPYYKESRRESSRILRQLRRHWQPHDIAEDFDVQTMARQLVKLGRLDKVEEAYILERHTPMPKDKRDLERDILRQHLEGTPKVEGKPQPPVERDAALEERSRIESMRKSMPNFDDSAWVQATEASILRIYYRAFEHIEYLQKKRKG